MIRQGDEPQGGKAAGLLRLAEVVAVPDFTVLSGDWIAEHAERLGDAIADRIGASGLKPPFAVRSSADLEDGLNDSYAGLYETNLGVDAAGLLGAVLNVWNSASSVRVEEYQQARGAAGEESKMSVIVQEMVAAKVSGVAFSRDPEDGQSILLEAVRGVGEELVSGTARPDLYKVRREDRVLIEERRGRQYAETLSDGSRRQLSGREVSEPRLSREDAVALAGSILELEAVFPEAIDGVDVEWAMDADGVKFLQCRPITSGHA